MNGASHGSADEMAAPGPAGPALLALVARQIGRTGDPAARAMAAHLAARPGAAAVLMYGNRLRDPEAAGLLDFYVLTQSDQVWHGAGIAALANRVLPPSVYHVTLADPPVAAKVAVMSLPAFAARMGPGGRDTSLWARFVQPAALLAVSDEATRAAVIGAIADGWRTAAWWADRLADGTGATDGAGRWGALFAATYGAELRVEAGARGGAILAADPALYAAIDRILPPATVDAARRSAARRTWRRRQAVGRALNLARLVKAAFTFRGGMAYALAKIDRHAAPKDALRPWERRVPWLAAPLVLWRLMRRRRLRRDPPG